MTKKIDDHGEALESQVRILIRKLVSEISPLRECPEAHPDQKLRDELGYDSVRQVELTFFLEELFGFDSLVIEEAPFMETVGDLEAFTLELIAQGRATIPSQVDIERARELLPSWNNS